jgi:hypothetical protein
MIDPLFHGSRGRESFLDFIPETAHPFQTVLSSGTLVAEMRDFHFDR